MTTLLFFPESHLKAWQATGAARLSEGVAILTDPATRSASEYALEPAVHVTAYLGTETGELDRDPHALVGRVVTLASLAALGGTLGNDTLSVGPSRYAVVRGHFAAAKDGDLDHERILSDLSSRFREMGDRS